MHAHVLQHVPFEGLGSIEPWLQQRSAVISYTRFFERDVLPQPQGIDLVIAMGGPMSVNEEDQYGWLREEKRFLAGVIHEGTAVLGVCLGAQLVASSLGASVYSGPEKEIGWFPVTGQDPVPGVFPFPKSIEAFHWHGETFDLPPGARLLAGSQVFRHQAFQVGPQVMGLQCHLEATPAAVEAMIVHCRQELVPQRYVQSEAQLRSKPESAYRKINAVMSEVLEFLTRNIPE
jgi:GMP synthase-like glutamine amidotransferase